MLKKFGANARHHSFAERETTLVKKLDASAPRQALRPGAESGPKGPDSFRPAALLEASISGAIQRNSGPQSSRVSSSSSLKTDGRDRSPDLSHRLWVKNRSLFTRNGQLERAITGYAAKLSRRMVRRLISWTDILSFT
jgi:hypothetical protein